MTQSQTDFVDVTARPKFWQSYPLLMIGALFAHLWLIYIGLNGQGTPMGDILFAYKPWVDFMLKTHQLYGINEAWVYPYPAQFPIWVAEFINPNDFQAGWLTMITILDLVALSLLVKFGKRDAESEVGFVAGWFWIFFLVALGPVSISRIDAVSVAIAIFGVIQMTRKHLSQSTTWFTFAAWMKIWPVALVSTALVGSKHWMRVLVSAVATSAIVLLVGFLLGGNLNLFGFLADQQARGLQLEAPISSVFIWAAEFGVGNAVSYYDQHMMTFQLAGDGTAVAASLMTPTLAIALLITLWLTWRAQRAGRHHREIMPIAALTAVLDLIFFNKVGSPQFVTWLAVPIILGVLYRAERWRFAMISVSVIALLTELVYPTFYGAILQGETGGFLILLIRNLAYLVLLVYANLRLSSLAAKPKAGQPRHAQ
jgi:hypothetical protein